MQIRCRLFAISEVFSVNVVDLPLQIWVREPTSTGDMIEE